MSRPAFSHFIVLRSGVPCVLLTHPHVAPLGVLIPIKDQKPTEFECVRTRKYPTTYARRRVLTAINRTDDFIKATRNSLMADHPFVQQVAAAGYGLWQIQAFLCPKIPKVISSPSLSRPPVPIAATSQPT